MSTACGAEFSSDLIQPVSTVNLDIRLKLFMQEGIELMKDLEDGSKDLTYVEDYTKRVGELLGSNIHSFYVLGKDVLNSVKACKGKVQNVRQNCSDSAMLGKLDVLEKLLDRFIGIYDKEIGGKWSRGYVPNSIRDIC